MTKNFNGFKGFGEKLNKATEETSGNVSFDKLFNEGFMAKYSNLQTIDEMFDQAGVTIESEDDFTALPEEKLNSIVKQHTNFGSWKEMLGKASEEYLGSEMKKRLR